MAGGAPPVEPEPARSVSPAHWTKHGKFRLYLVRRLAVGTVKGIGVMDEEALLVELDVATIRDLRKLMVRFGVKRVDTMIVIAVGVMNELKDFERNGVVTIVDPDVTTSNPRDREVELEFETFRIAAKHPNKDVEEP